MEQTIVSNYLKNGGNLFVSGSEIAWDLDYKGSSSDKNFIWNYLKMQYAADAPFNTSGTYYSVTLFQNNYIKNISPFSFDNGTHGTINVKWPDVIKSINGGIGFLQYSALDAQNGFAGILYDGMFPNGLANGKVLSLGFPFETIYPEETRIALMSEIIKYFNSISDINDSENSGIITEYKLEQNYPNPFNPTTTIRYSIPNNLGTIQNLPLQNVKLTIYDILGREVTTLVNEAQKSGNYEVTFDASNLASGVYLYRLQSTTSSNSGKDFFDTKKMILLK